MSSAALLGFVEAADQKIDSLHGLVVLRHGRVVAEGWWTPYGPGHPHELYSLSKSFTSTAIGMAIDEKKLHLDDEVLKFFPSDAPEKPSENLKSMRVHDLLRMSTGHQDEPPMPGGPSVKSFLAQPVPFKPGSHFKYNTPATYMLSAILQKVTGQTVLDYLRPRLFEPLGIRNPTWSTSPEGVSLGGYGLSVTTEDIACFGQLLLQEGEWRGKPLVSRGWVQAASARQTSNGSNPRSDWDQGYGYQFWRCRHGAFRGDGAFGQYCLVLPDQDAVIAITAGVKDMQAVLDLVWDQLLPGLKPRRLSADETTAAKLTARLASLRIHPPAGSPTSPTLAAVAGRKFVFDANDQGMDWIRLESTGAGQTTLVLHGSGAESRLSFDAEKWTPSHLPVGGNTNAAVAALGTWETPDTLALKMCVYETPFVVTHRFRFAGDRVFHRRDGNVGFSSPKAVELVGEAKE